MEELSLRPDERELLRTINRPEGTELPSRPFEREIYLISLMVAGTAYAQNIDTLFRSLKEGDLLRLVREPENPYDEYAIRVETADAETIGYNQRVEDRAASLLAVQKFFEDGCLRA